MDNEHHDQSFDFDLKRKFDDQQQQQQHHSADGNKKLKTTDEDDKSNQPPPPPPSSSSSSDQKSTVEDETNIKIDSIELNPIFRDKIDELKKSYNESNPLESECSTITIEPFKVFQLHRFIENDQLVLPQILQAVNTNTISMERRNNDLYSLKQSNDLKTYPLLENIVTFFRIKVKLLLEEITGLKLNNNVALTFSKYEQNDYLLCHDDQLEQRKIAFILYLVDEQWSATDGGQLELFATEPDAEGHYDAQPTKITTKLTPKSNTLAFFEVNSKSFHQVGEILTNRSPRWSINGWFHSDDASISGQIFRYPQLSAFPENEILEDDLTEHFLHWINPIYLQNFTQKQIRASFNRNSEIQLKNFINEDKCEQIQQALSSEQVRKLWHKNYKPLFFRNQIIHPQAFQQLPDILREFYLLINSKNFYKLITTITGVIFVSKSKNSTNQQNQNGNDNDDDDVQLIQEPSTSILSSIETTTKYNHKTRGAIIEWNHGDYSLSSDINPDIHERALDLDFFFNVPRPIVKSTKNFGDQEIIDVSDDDDDVQDTTTTITKKEPENEMETKSDAKEESKKQEEKIESKPEMHNKSSDNDDDDMEQNSKHEPELIELNSDDDDDDDDGDGLDEDLDDDEEDEEELDDDDDYVDQHDDGDDSGHLATTNGGGYIAYITDESDEQVLEIEPNNNYLNIVYRNYQCQRFMKYIDHSNTRVPFQQITIIFTDH
ncbi:Prolyl 3-hydroxylase ogfod1 [Dermatophagoides farinae]|uniref:uS12 prolyl 3-hydroxylase n=1 Tax=Dermatophagoides farinae TaxID=6954 RepID=A0A922HRN5_DERFA|nr:Prolyl 3-hydroxylase ogfod1 [Dermatophagoides farinae]